MHARQCRVGVCHIVVDAADRRRKHIAVRQCRVGVCHIVVDAADRRRKHVAAAPHHINDKLHLTAGARTINLSVRTQRTCRDEHQIQNEMVLLQGRRGSRRV
jgi:hypothetical protein